jgi:hypothetical protein
MIAVRALYKGSKIELLEPPPALAQAPVIVIFLETEGVDDILAPYAEQMAATNWGEPMDGVRREAAGSTARRVDPLSDRNEPDR